MRSYFIETLEIHKLWGYRDINLSFHRDVNILIGPNASGKTTILNFLHSILSVEFPSLLAIGFDEAEIKLRGFEGNSVRTVKIKNDTANRLLKISVGQSKFDLDIDVISDRRIPKFYRRAERGDIAREMPPRHFIRGRIVPGKFYDALTTLVPIVWLPVSRRLPVTEDEGEQFTMMGVLESVDLRLRELQDELSLYHSGLNAQLSKRYKEFEHQVLSVILYSREHDQPDSIPSSLPTKAEKEQLRRAFEAAGLLDEQMEIRIADHFTTAEEALKRIRGKKANWDLKDILVLPLIGRTQSMVRYAGELEKDREGIFASVRRYEDTVNSFLNEKSVKVDESGHLDIQSNSRSGLDPRFLSSGEKQILILLTQALLRADKPVVYMADEPELSLHVLWQEKLLESLVRLGRQTKVPPSDQMQIIVATHSPDIVGRYKDKVIDLGRSS